MWDRSVDIRCEPLSIRNAQADGSHSRQARRKEASGFHDRKAAIGCREARRDVPVAPVQRNAVEAMTEITAPADSSWQATWATVTCPTCKESLFVSADLLENDKRNKCLCGIVWRTKVIGVGTVPE